VSCGVAAYGEEMGTIEDLVAAADQALYAAKGGGRDRVVLAGSRPVSGSAY
jgi:PleD family two-component response regulator